MAVSSLEAELVIEPEWEAAAGVRTPELAATWARLEMRVGWATLTQVEDATSNSVRRSIYVPLYPLAEWIAFNWWYLRSDTRPGFLPEHTWSFARRNGHNKHEASWLDHHNLRGAAEGLPWPDLTIIPGVDTTYLAWRGDRSYGSDSKLRFLSSGRAAVSKHLLERALVGLVETVLTRLDEQGVHGTVLQEEWRALQALDKEEAEFCIAAARLGLDPFSLPESVEELILKSAQELSGSLLEDFLDAATPTQLQEDLDWLAEVSEVIAGSQQHTLDLPPVVISRHGRPWERGFYGARQFRSLLDIAPTRRVELEPWVAVEHVRLVDRPLQGVGEEHRHDARVVALAGPRSVPSEAFATARALWRFLSSPPERGTNFLITSSQTPLQQAERAFAAEFLAPAVGIKQLLGEDAGGPVELDEVAAVSQHFQVNDWVVEYQIINQLERDVRDPALERSAWRGY